MTTSLALDLLNNAAATGNPARWPGGKGSFVVAGTFGGATVKLQLLGPDGATWLDVSAATALAAVGHAVFEAGAGQLRALVSGGAPAGLYAKAVRIAG
ncbi:MAG: hypothetical protein AB7G15_17145 [Alphaproteobacteria bacterium]